MAAQDPVFIDNPAVKTREGHYVTLTVDVTNILKSWKESLFSYEWMLPDGTIKTQKELSETEGPKRAAVEQKLEKGETLERPVLGIGLLENVEIGAGRATFLTLAAHGAQHMSVHIPKSCEKEFAPFLPGAAPKKERKPRAKKSNDDRAGESGNVLFIILIAVMLIGALSFAVSQSSRTTSGNISNETQRLTAASMLEYSDSVRRAVAQLRTRGISQTSISFANPGAGTSNEIFNPAGAGLVYKAPDVAALTAANQWIFFATEQVSRMGTTCAAATCSELMIGVRGVKREICIMINDLLDVDNPTGEPPVVAAFTTAPAFAGTYSVPAHTIGATGALLAQQAACLFDTNGADYVFYQILIPR